MENITLRYSGIQDAQRFYEMISSEKYLYFWWRMTSVDDALDYFQRQQQRYEAWYRTEHMYSIILDEKVIGSVWIVCIQHRRHVGEIGYFVDEAYWGKGIATQAVKMVEKLWFEDLWFQRLTIVLKPENVASEKVAIKSGYTKEAYLHSEIRNPEGTLHDALLYAKLKTQYKS